MVETGWRIFDQTIGETFRDFGGEEAGMSVGERVELAMKRRDDFGMAMAEAGHCRAAGCVDIGVAVAVEQFNAAPANGDRHGAIGGAVEDMGHEDFSRRRAAFPRPWRAATNRRLRSYGAQPRGGWSPGQ